MSHTAFALLLSLMLAPNLLSRCSQSNLRGDTAGQSSTLSSTAFVRDESEVLIRGGWVQEGPPSQTITAAYMTIENHTGADLLAGFSWKDPTLVGPARAVLNSATKNPGNDFALTDQDDKPFHLSQLRGKVVFLLRLYALSGCLSDDNGKTVAGL